jgi:hypothetical protein
MSSFPLVLIRQSHVKGVAVAPLKKKSVFPIYPNAALSLAVVFIFFKVVSGYSS